MIRLSCNVRTVVSADGAVLLDVQRGQMFRANAIGSKILELLMLGSSEVGIGEEISRLYDIPREAIASDVREFLAALEQQGLVETDGRSGTRQGIRK